MKRTQLPLLFNLFFCCFLTQIFSQSISTKIDEVMNKYIELNQFSGTVLLAKEGIILYEKAFGDANKSYKIKNNIHTKFNIASMGKMFTGIAIMQLEEQKKLNLNDPVIMHLNNFPFGNQITVFHLLSHTSGLDSYMRHPKFQAARTKMRKINDVLPFIYEQKPLFKTPGKRFIYSNSGMVVLGAIIEKITGQSYTSYITNNILKPAEMDNTQMSFWDNTVENRAFGYIKTLSESFHNNLFLSNPPLPDGGIMSTIHDLFKFDQALYSSLLISDASKEKMFKTVIPKITYGLAFQVENRQKNKVVGHGGGAPGISTYFSRYLKDKYTIIVLSNYDMIARNVVHYIEDIIYGKEYHLPQMQLSQFIYKHQTTIKSLNTYETQLSYIQENYTIRSPRHLNMIAYQFMHEGDINFAVILFNLNTFLFPNEANVYDSLGEAYEKINNNSLALKNYTKAVDVAKKNSDPSLNSFTKTLERFKSKKY